MTLSRIQMRRGNAADWTSSNPILKNGEIGFSSDTGDVRIGNGVNHWLDLDSISGGGGGVGDVVGPASSTADSIAIYNGLTGKILKDSGRVVPTSNIVGVNDLQTLTGKLIAPRFVTITSASSLTGGAVYDLIDVSALGVGMTINPPVGTFYPGQELTYRIKDTGTAKALVWDAVYREMGATLPTTTVPGKVLYITVVANPQDSTFDVTEVRREGRSPSGDAYTTGARPSAVAARAGAQIYDLTLSRPIWSDGTVWRDASGTAV